MGYGFYTVGAIAYLRGNVSSRPAGYLVQATCDKRGCDVLIDRGLGYLCGDRPHDAFSDEPGCGRYYCADHSGGWPGPRGGCAHGRRGLAWGKTLSDMVPNADGSALCLDPVGHAGPHAWAIEEAETLAAIRSGSPAPEGGE